MICGDCYYIITRLDGCANIRCNCGSWSCWKCKQLVTSPGALEPMNHPYVCPNWDH